MCEVSTKTICEGNTGISLRNKKWLKFELPYKEFVLLQHVQALISVRKIDKQHKFEVISKTM